MKQKEDTLTVDFEDVMLWSDGHWCYRYQFAEMRYRSDDYKIIHFGTSEYKEFFERLVRS